jgi:hypothetical protein
MLSLGRNVKMSTYSVINTIMVVGVILAPITVIGFVFGFLRNLKSDKRESLEMTSAIQNSLFSLMMGLVMRGPQPMNGSQQTFQQPIDNEFVNWNNQDFYNDPNVYQVPAVANSRMRQKPYQPKMLNNSQAMPQQRNNGFLIGLLTGLVVFLALALFTMIVAKF